MNAATVPPGRWQHAQRHRAAAASPVWISTVSGVFLMSGNLPLASARSNRRDGAEQRWVLQVAGWEWRDCDKPDAYHGAKAFRSRAGAQLEAEDIIAAAGDWGG